MWIDVNKVDNDVMKEHIAPENEKAKEMLDRICMEELWVSAQEVYLRWIIKEIKYLQDNAKDAADREKLLKFYKELDSVWGYSKDKRNIEIKTQLRSAKDIFDTTNIN